MTFTVTEGERRASVEKGGGVGMERGMGLGKIRRGNVLVIGNDDKGRVGLKRGRWVFESAPF
jgi:hypothetical protein